MSGASEPSQARIEVELSLDTDPISGRIRGADGSHQAFSGWLELIGVLEGMRGAHPRPPGRTSTCTAKTAEPPSTS